MKSSTPSTAPFPGRSAAIFSVLCFGGLSAALMQSLVIPIQGSLPHLLATSPSTASWVLTATLLSAGVAMAVGGRLADIHGKKPVLIGTAAMLLLGSVLCALAPSVTLLLTGRVLQGFAMGYIPVAISAVRQVVPVHLSNTAVAGVSATLGVGGALGLPLAAWIAQVSDWHNLFWVSAALGAVVMVLSLTVVPDLQDAHPGKLDVVGVVGLAVGLLGVLVGFSKGNEWGWGSPLTLVMLVGGAVVLLLWGWYELGRDEPLVDLRTTARAPVLFTNIAAVLIGFGMMAQSVVVPQLLELPTATGHGLGQSILQAGLWMAPGGLVMMLFTPISSRLLNALGGRITLAVGAGVLAGGYVIAVFMTNAPWQLMVASCVASAGVGIGYAAMPTLILRNVPEEEASAGVGLNSLMRSVGTTVAGAVMALVLTSNTQELGAGADPVPTGAAFQLCFFIGALAALAGMGIVLLIPREGRVGEATASVEDAGPAAVADPQACRESDTAHGPVPVRPSGAPVEDPSAARRPASRTTGPRHRAPSRRQLRQRA